MIKPRNASSRGVIFPRLLARRPHVGPFTPEAGTARATLKGFVGRSPIVSS